MTVRDATVSDIPRVVEMGHRFLQHTSYRDMITDNPTQMTTLATHLVSAAGGLLLVADSGRALVGMIGVLVFDHHISGERIAGEVFWWVEPEMRGIGLKLLRAAEAWAVAQEAFTMQMIAPNEGVGTIYERFGYARVETCYQRRLAQ